VSRQRRRQRPRVSHERWLVSYADFITLLFAFFVVLFATAKADQQKQAEFSKSINDAFRALGIFPDTLRRQASANTASNGTEKPEVPMNIVMGEDVLAPAQVKADLEHIRRELQQTLSNEVAKHTVSIEMGRDGLVISLREAGFFASGSAVTKPDTQEILRRISAALNRTPYDVRVEGHTDNIPIHNAQFDSNWELSTARATSIARLLLGMNAIRADRISAAGYSEFHPIAPNDTDEGRARNRRVDLVILPRSKVNFADPKSGAPSANWRKITEGE
jgi:chemotaxis protein MotB